MREISVIKIIRKWSVKSLEPYFQFWYHDGSGDYFLITHYHWIFPSRLQLTSGTYRHSHCWYFHAFWTRKFFHPLDASSIYENGIFIRFNHRRKSSKSHIHDGGCIFFFPKSTLGQYGQYADAIALAGVMFAGLLGNIVMTVMLYIYSQKVHPVGFRFDRGICKHILQASLPYGLALF